VCARGDGIRRSKDLRAEIGKFPNSTNERKIMSKKTMKQRIALVAVTALTAGFLSVATSPVANAAAGDIDVVAPGSTVSGICSVAQSGSFLTNGATSVGTLAAPITVTMALGGVLLLDVESTHINYSSNGVIAGSTFDTTPVLNSSYGVFYGVDNDTVTLTATAVGTATVNSYVSAPFSAANTANAILATPNGTMTVVVVAACSATGYSATYSAFQVSTAATSEPSLTIGDTLTFSAGSAGFISIVAKNGYNEALPATTSFVASATNGALVKIGASGTSAASANASTYSDGTLSSASEVLAGTNVYVKVVPASKTLGGTTTVTVTAGGVTVLTKTLTFLPEASKLVVVKNLSGSLTLGEGAFLYELQTASGVSVPGALAVRTLTLDPRVTSVTAIKDASIQPAVPGSTVNTVATATALLGSSTSTTKYGISKFACNSGSTTGSTKVTLRHTTPVTEANIDTEVTLSCAGGVATYTVSTDKAAYKIGEVATITVTAKDSTGAAVSDFTAMPTADALSVGGGTLIKNTTTNDVFSGGVKTYQAQMTTAGSFNVASTISGSVTKTATTGYSISGGDASNADVLKSIVALIASINKQIQALQKLILKR
jgi:hypothetical protein